MSVRKTKPKKTSSLKDEEAQQVLAEQADVVMPPADWKAFCKALDAPPRVIPALKTLFTEASVFDRQGRGIAQ